MMMQCYGLAGTHSGVITPRFYALDRARIKRRKSARFFDNRIVDASIGLNRKVHQRSSPLS